ncbi:Leucyl-cystinyl aminopeptidase [Dissostichus eleginoides]|uniref:Leucyl-cystinyl aminopeptidase n=1 Tax=Dissostichus eleginoides TaxID=100907 RepID=A0AAD9BQU7_DISEL|nr:Leucyl-cystinyl aminopeptidase [Dissostichus eleginoides]
MAWLCVYCSSVVLQLQQEWPGSGSPGREPGCFMTQVARVGGQEDGGHEGCVPGFQVKHYQVAYSGAFQKGQALIQGQ